MRTLTAPPRSIPLTRRRALASGLGAFALLATGCSRRQALIELSDRGLHTFRGLSMGSSYTVKIAAPGLSAAALAAAQQAVAGALADVVQHMSHYDPDSQVSRLNRQALGRPLAVSESTLRVFEAAAKVQEASGGAFDVTVGRAVDAWGFGPTDKARRVLSGAALAELQAVQRAGALTIDARSGTLTRHAAVHANLSGVAKGHGVDRAAQALDALGLGDYMVEVGGEIRTRGINARGEPWQPAIERPDAMPQQALLIVPLGGRALATSGDYRNFFMEGGRRYSHEIEPATAAPVDHALASVSVVAADCTQADAWSTALFVLGPQRGPETAHRLGLAAYFVQRRPDGSFGETATAAFAALGARAAG
jgi:thiamine biosynthesis lipoprotein